MALQIMPKLLSLSIEKQGGGKDALILVATSGDTGKAALEGYRDVERVRILVFYPTGGVSRIQQKQMATQAGNNVGVIAIRGNFDDAQTAVKRVFGSPEMAAEADRHGFFFSSANSINWGRLAPQIVYYVSAYCDLLHAGRIQPGEPVNICVPTGNFGNILAAYIAKRMGLPVDKLICASNRNHILTDFFETGVYDRNRAFYTTISPSMDILISSNLERLLYFAAGPETTKGWMALLAETWPLRYRRNAAADAGRRFHCLLSGRRRDPRNNPQPVPRIRLPLRPAHRRRSGRAAQVPSSVRRRPRHGRRFDRFTL